MGTGEGWLSTEDVARYIGGVSARWVRNQIDSGKLPARALMTGARPTYRIRQTDVQVFMRTYIRDASSLDRDR
jgi:excisionase family DNA binding protein